LEHWLKLGLYIHELDTLSNIVLLIMKLGASFILATIAGPKNLNEWTYSDKFYNYFLGIGACLLIHGCYLLYCLISPNLFTINPDIHYSWDLSWLHGINSIPRWIYSLFNEDIILKAPNSSLAYSVSWWISSLFSLTIFSAANIVPISFFIYGFDDL
jgi:hypothetical protein